MNERVKAGLWVFLALRAVTDLALAFVIGWQVGSILAGAAMLLVCSVFYLFLYFGIKKEEFPGRNGRRVALGREPVAYWFVAALLVAFHLTITFLMILIIYRQAIENRF